MSNLRKQLEAGREQYRSQRYPGDLAAQLLGQPQRRSVMFKMFIGAAGVSGIAAAIALLVMMSGPATTPTRTQRGGVVVANGKPPSVVTSLTTQPAGESVAPVTELASMPQFPQDVPMA